MRFEEAEKFLQKTKSSAPTRRAIFTLNGYSVLLAQWIYPQPAYYKIVVRAPDDQEVLAEGGCTEDEIDGYLQQISQWPQWEDDYKWYELDTEEE